MENIQKYIDFAEGSLDSESEQSFAYQFAEDDDFRSGFRSYLLATNSINQNIKLFGPSESDTNDLFAKLGIEDHVDNTEPLPVPSAGIFQKLSLREIYIGVFSIIGTALLMLWLLTPSSNMESNKVTLSNNKNIISQNNADIPFKDKIVGNKPENFTQLKNSVKQVSIKSQKYKNEKHSEDKNFVILSNENEISIDSSKYSSIKLENIKESVPFLSSEKFKISERQIKPDDLQKIDIHLMPVNKDYFDIEKSPISFSYSYSFDFMTPKPTIDPSNKDKFIKNLSMVSYYNINKNLSLGMGFRMENFFLRYHGFDKFGLGATYELQPNFDTFSGIIKYEITEYKDIYPNIKLSLGCNDVGFVNRISIGASWRFYRGYYLTLDLEHSNMIYNTEKTYFYSNKYGLSFGLYFNFENN